MKIQKIITASPGLSGSGLLSDFFLSCNDFETPFKKFKKGDHQAEFRFVHDPGGLESLYNGFYENFSITNSSYVYNEFNNYVENLKKFSVLKNKKNIFVYDKNFFNLIENFKKKIIKLEYYGLPQFYRLGLNKKDRIFWRLSSRFKSAQEVKFFKMVLPVDKEIFLKEARNLIEKYCKNSLKKKIVIDQGVNFWNPISSLKFYENAKVILVIRDPRSVYSSMKKRQSLSYPGHDVYTFIDWYQTIMNRFEKLKKSPDIKIIKYENFLLNHAYEKKKLLNFLGLKKNKDFKYDLSVSEKNIFKAKKSLSKHELKIIKKKLAKYLLWPKN